MKIAIIGAGAMGSLYGGYLSGVEDEVYLIDIWKEHVDEINEQRAHHRGEGKAAAPASKGVNGTRRHRKGRPGDRFREVLSHGEGDGS